MHRRFLLFVFFFVSAQATSVQLRSVTHALLGRHQIRADRPVDPCPNLTSLPMTFVVVGIVTPELEAASNFGKNVKKKTFKMFSKQRDWQIFFFPLLLLKRA